MFERIRKSLGGMLGRDTGEARLSVSGGYPSRNRPDNCIEVAMTDCPTVRSCVTTVARGIAELQIICETAEAQRVIDAPNSFQTRYEYIHAVVQDLVSYGYHVSRRVYLGSRLVGLVPYTPRNVTPKWKNGLPEFDITDTEGGHETLALKDVVFYRDGGGSEIMPSSRIKDGWSIITALMEANKKIADTFEHGVDVGTCIKPSKPLGSKEKMAILNTVRDEFSGRGQKRGGVVLLENAELERIKGITPADSELQNLRQDLIREIAALWGVPPFLAGATGQDKYSNITARLSSMYRDCYAPLLGYLSERLSLALGCKVRFDDSDLLAGDLMSQAKAATLVAGGPVLTTNEARGILNYVPVDKPEYNDIRLTGIAPDMDVEQEGDTGDRPDR